MQRQLLLHCCATALLLCLLLVSSIEAVDAAIKKIEIEGLYSIKGKELLDLLDLKIGAVLDVKHVRKGIETAFLKGIFEDISVELDDADSSNVRIKVRERDVIRRIYVTGNNRLRKKIIKESYLFKEGQTMRYDLIDDSIKSFKEAISERGFPHADISMRVEKANRPYSINLYLKIDEGTPEIIKRIKVYGPEEARRLIEISEGDIYDQVKLRKNLKKIIARYKKNDYLHPAAGPYIFTNGELEIDINPGKKLNIIFKGNAAVDSKILLKEAPFFDAEEFRDDLAEEAVSRITFLYHSKGYPSAYVYPVVTSGEDIIEAHFFIFEGDETTVNAINFSGVTIDEKRLKDILPMKEGDLYNPDLVESYRTTLTEFYNALGYLSASADDIQVELKGGLADIAIKIREGERTDIESIEIRGAELVLKEAVGNVIRLQKGDHYNDVDISDARYRIIDLYESYGFTDVKVDVKQEFTGGRSAIIFEIDEGHLTFFGKTVISGNTETTSETIRRELPYKEGATFSHALLTKTRQRLYKLGLFTDVDTEALEKDEDIKNIHVKVKEGNAGMVEFGLGYGDYERYRGSFDISYRNLFGMSRQISFRTEFSSLEERYIVNYLEPWFLGKSLPFRMLFLREDRTEKDISSNETRYKIKRHNASAGFEKKLTEKFKTELFYEFSLVNTYDVMPDVIITKEDSGTLAISGIRPGIAYDSRDNPFDPHKGVFAGISVKAASGILFSETDFVKAIVNGSIYRELSKYFILAVSLKSGIAQGFSKTRELPLVERFFLGGRTTVRGYEQDMLGPKGANGSPTGGNAFVLTNLELRTSLGKNFGLVTFLDGGNVWIKASDIDISEMRYTAGIGIRYNTPVGPIRVDYGHKLDREKGESKGEVHFTIGHAF